MVSLETVSAPVSVVADGTGQFQLALPVGDYLVTVTSVVGGMRTARIRVPEVLILQPTQITLAGSGANRLPSNGRSVIAVVRETASVTAGQPGGDLEGSGPYGLRGDLGLNSAGLRSQSNHFDMDGLDINEPWSRGPMLVPPSESIQAVNLLNGYVPAGIGHSAGAAVVMQTKGGTSTFHGSSFYDLRNSVLDARNSFGSDRKPASLGNRFGGTFSGPVRKDNWFLFASAELNRNKEGLTILSTVPTSAQRAGIFARPIFDPLTITSIGENVFSRAAFPNNRIPLTRIPASVQKMLALYPDANLSGNANNYRYQPSAIRNGSHFDLQSDKTLSTKSAVSLRLAYHTNDGRTPGTFPLASSFGSSSGSDSLQSADTTTTKIKAWAGAVSHTLQLSSSINNRFRLGLSTYVINAQPNDHNLNASQVSGIPGLDAGLPLIELSGYTSLGSSGPVPLQVRSSNFQIGDEVSWTTRHHAWSFGVQLIQRRSDGTASESNSRGNFIFTPDYTSFPGTSTGDSFASFLLGFPSEVKRDVQFARFELRGVEWSGFVQDQFRWKRLTIQAGLRYSLLPPVTEANSRMVNFNFLRVTPALNQFAGQGSVNGFGGLNLNRRALAPRIGFVFEINANTILRGGFSKSFDTGTYLTMGRLARNAPYASQLDLVNGTFQLGANITAGLPSPVAVSLMSAASLNASGQAVNAIEPEKFTPYADQWNLFVQRRMRHLTAEFGGIGSMGIHLYAAYDANQPFPAPTPYATARYPFEAFHGRVNYLNLGGGSTYYGGQAKLSGQVITGLQVQLSYAFAKSLDDATSPGTNTSASRPAGPQFIYNARGNRSPSTFDITHRAVLSANYRVPLIQASASALVTLQSGFPFTPQLATNSLNDGGFQLPNRVGDGSLAAKSPAQWFDTRLPGAFLVPALYQYGNSGFGILRGPGLATVDVSLAREFRVWERLQLESRIEAFNLLNRANFALPNRLLGTTAAGSINHTVTPARQLQLSILLRW